MASDLRLRVGGATGIITFNATDAQVAEALRRYARRLGIPAGGTANENLTAILEHLRDEIRRIAKEVQTAELRAANESTIQSRWKARARCDRMELVMHSIMLLQVRQNRQG
ncbi:MAG: hypothetical protein IPK16_30345 [Anaerolineales bacterium]|nr:hypothetical protein [Anaerolineales bacterium]